MTDPNDNGDVDPVTLMSQAITNPPPQWPALAEHYPDLNHGLAAIDDGVNDALLSIGADDWDDGTQFGFFQGLQAELRNFGHDLNRQAQDRADQW